MTSFPSRITATAAAVRQAITLRPYQAELEAGIYAQWQAGARNVLAVLPTGGGKTVLFAKILADTNGASVAIAHRQELVSQISLALARYGVRHTIIAPAPVVKTIVALHLTEVGVTYFDPNARCAVAGVDTLIRRDPSLPWFAQVVRWVQDEAHHVLKSNKWGKAAEMFPNAYGLGVTATPCRADGMGLGRHADGLFDAMVCGPGMRWLIDNGYLTGYRIFCAPEVVDISKVAISDATGDFNQTQLRKAVHENPRIVGDVVAHYLKHAAGKLGVTFAVDIDEATKIAASFNAAGVPAEVVSSKTPDPLRVAILRRFRNRELLQLVNVDLFGEGFDLPAIEVVSFARHTASLSLYMQQFGRALRPLEGKGKALIIDHVGNVIRHGLPDRDRSPGTAGGWSLDRREKRARQGAADATPLRACLECFEAYERVLVACPYCGAEPPPPAGRSAPEFVDGDLLELDEAFLSKLRGEIQRIDSAPAFPPGLSAAAAGALKRNHWERQQAQGRLRNAIAWYGGYQRALGRPDGEGYRRFYHAYGLDVMTAQTLNAREADDLAQKITEDLARVGVVVTDNVPGVPV